METEISKEMPAKEKRELIFGPKGAIAQLNNLMQVLTKLSDQLGMVQATKSAETMGEESLTAEEMTLLQEWLAVKR